MRILIVGGSGVTGSMIRSNLHAYDVDVWTASRHRPREDRDRHFVMDVRRKPADAIEVMRRFDWIVNCTGPFEDLGDTVAKLSIQAASNYIDVNDSIDARREIRRLDPDARAVGVHVLTGFGLCPGLSTALMMNAVDTELVAPESVTGIRTDLVIGEKQVSGAAAIGSMFRTMHGDYRVLRHGVEATLDRATASRPVEGAVANDEAGANADGRTALIGYECPDIDVVTSLFPNLLGYEYRVAFEAIDDAMVTKLQQSRVFTLPVVSAALARLAARGTARSARATAGPEPSTLTVSFDDSGVRSTVTGLSSYAITAVVPAVTLGALLETDTTILDTGPGVIEVAQRPAMVPHILRGMKDAGATIDVLPAFDAPPVARGRATGA